MCIVPFGQLNVNMLDDVVEMATRGGLHFQSQRWPSPWPAWTSWPFTTLKQETHVGGGDHRLIVSINYLLAINLVLWASILYFLNHYAWALQDDLDEWIRGWHEQVFPFDHTQNDNVYPHLTCMCLCGVPAKLIAQVSQHADVERLLLAVIATMMCISLLSALIKFVASGNVHMKIHT